MATVISAKKLKVGSRPKRMINFDLLEKEMKGLELGEDVTLTITAKVKGLSAPYEYEMEEARDEERDPYGDVRLEVQSYKFSSGENEFEKIAKQEDEE